MNIDPVRRVLDSIGAPYALIGAHAMAARGYPRFTVDVDLLTTDGRVLTRETWAELERESAIIDPRRGDADDPLGGVVHILLADQTDVDVVLAKWTWQAHVIERADLIPIAGANIRVPRTGDLVLLKLTAGGYLDLRDAAALLAVGDRATVIRDVEAHIHDVYPDVGRTWRELRAALDR